MINTAKKLNSYFTAATLSAILLLAFSHTVSAQEYKKIKRLGTSQSVCAGGIQTGEELQQFFAKNPDVVRAILADSGWSGSADDLMAAVANGQFEETAYPVGTRFAWMGAKKRGSYLALPYREWAGKKSFEAFRVNVSTSCQVYHIAIPKACCNVGLIAVEPDQSEACNKPVAVAPVAEEAPAAPVEQPKAKAKTLFPFFGLFAGSETRPRYEPAWDMDVKDSSGVVGVRAGLMKELSEKNSVFGQLSYYKRNGVNEYNIYPDNNLALDLGMERKLSQNAFIGGGVGLWNIDDSDYRDTSLFGHVGGGLGKSNLQWFLEGRVFDSDSKNLDSLSNNKMFSAGVRYLVK